MRISIFIYIYINKLIINGKFSKIFLIFNSGALLFAVFISLTCYHFMDKTRKIKVCGDIVVCE